MSLEKLQSLFESFPWLKHNIRGKLFHPQKQKLFVEALRQWSNGFIQTHTINPQGNKTVRYYASVFPEQKQYSTKDNLYISLHAHYGDTYSVSSMYEIDEKKGLYSWTSSMNTIQLNSTEQDIVNSIIQTIQSTIGFCDPTILQSWFSSNIEKRVFTSNQYTIPVHEKLLPELYSTYQFHVDDAYAYLSQLHLYQKEARIFKIPEVYIPLLKSEHFNDAISNSTRMSDHVLVDLIYFHEKRTAAGGDTLYLFDRAEIIIESLLSQRTFGREFSTCKLIVDAWQYLTLEQQKAFVSDTTDSNYSYLYPILKVYNLMDPLVKPNHPHRESIQDAYGWIHMIELPEKYFLNISTIFQHLSVDEDMIHAQFMNKSEPRFNGAIAHIFNEWQGFSFSELDIILDRFQKISSVDMCAMPNADTLKQWFIEALPLPLKTDGFADSGVLDTFFTKLLHCHPYVDNMNRADHQHNLSLLRGMIVAFTAKIDDDPCIDDISMIL